MTEECVCPLCGAPLPLESGASPIDAGPIREEVEPPPVELLASGSHDEQFLANSSKTGPPTAPDPILGPFVTPSSADSREASGSTRGPSSTFASLDLGAASPMSSVTDEREGDEPERRTAWASVLLASYASAITLALAWALWHRPRDREDSGNTPAERNRATPGRQAGLSRRVTPPEPILAEHVVGLEKPLIVGPLEVTPLEVSREEVQLQRTRLGGQIQRRDGGENALVLHLKLRNLSEDEVFAPLDPAFLREQEKVLVDTFLQTGSGQRIYPYPLALESEWSIVGQDFTPLRPREVRVVSIVSAPDAPPDEAGPFAWRVRLRTGIGRTDIIGVNWLERSPEPAK